MPVKKRLLQTVLFYDESLRQPIQVLVVYPYELLAHCLGHRVTADSGTACLDDAFPFIQRILRTDLGQAKYLKNFSRVLNFD